MLDHVAAFMCCDCSCRHGPAVIDRLTEVHSLGCRIVVVGELSGYAHHIDIIYSILLQHFTGNVRTGHAVSQRNFGIFAETTLEHILHEYAEDHE